MVIKFDPDFQLDEEEDLSNKIVDNKDDLFDQINQAENLTPACSLSFGVDPMDNVQLPRTNVLED